MRNRRNDNLLSMQKKLELWEKELSADKLALIAYAVNEGIKEEANKRADKQIYAINQYLDISISAALFEILGLSILQVNEILKRSNEFMKEAEGYLLKYGEDWIMQIEKVRPEVEKMIRQGLKDIAAEKTNKLEIIKAIKNKFNIPGPSIDKIYMEIKEKEFNDNCPDIYKPKSLENKAELEQKEMSRVNTPEKENERTVKRIGAKNKVLKLKLPLSLEGENERVYKVTENCVEYEDFRFRSLQDLENYIQEFNNHIEELKEAFGYM